MAFNIDFLDSVSSAINLINNRNVSNPSIKKLASVGYPDLLVRNMDIDKKIPSDLHSYFDTNNTALLWHNLDPAKYSYFSLEKYLYDLGWQFDYFDIQEGTGANQRGFTQLDLNKSIPPHLYSNYDVLIDSGTAEHCFNIGKVFENYFHLLKPGGILLQYVPFLSPNHGFWSVNPTAIFDLTSCNPIKIITCKLTAYDSYLDYFSSEGKILKFSDTSRFDLVCPNSNIVLLFFAYKKLAKSMFRFPIQAKYRQK